ncbi:MAG: beta-ketoacyl-ACP synthase II [Acidobacteria bacterium]|nr:beta-ketoacyl-ACP synthase II [Acidobacteriota bacterium]MBU1337512.1 beta-ketoacyl-ACP synthase II [Acidobacteriota bacterium]MBU2438902.1 beta-ketoacyl-ACP synthase II [Acidobacteriota bacterium]MBU4204410.1 beta-ketoacyl-ACP synthase II [Acidobacteriota bacterium]MBU4254888.1 beta-ketoacyl-ACP synthase II [Acidobacteriota bacterium]
MKKNRVVITGLGVVSPIGIGVEEFWTALTAGKNGIFKLTHFDPTLFRSQMAGEVKNFNPEDWMDRKTADRLDRFVHFSLAASSMAMKDADLESGSFDSYRAGVIIGSGIGGSRSIEEAFTNLSDKGPKAISPFSVTKSLINTAACQVSITHGLRGPLSSLSVACSTGANAIGDASRIIERGDADIMLAGGSEACLTPLPFGGFCSTRSMSTRNDDPETASRPFDKTRDGFVMGEGAGLIILENLESALNRGARIYGELVGYGCTADAFHMTAPEPSGDGMTRCMKAALADAGIPFEKIGHINAHGTSTLMNDKVESAAIIKVFGEKAKKIKISSNKSMIGHLLAAAGAVEFCASVLSVFSGIVPPTVNYSEPDPDCPLDYVVHGAEVVQPEAVLSNSFGFGGGNVSLVISKYRK